MNEKQPTNESTSTPVGVALEFATDNIWAMADRPGHIGLRFDSGDAGVIYLTEEQARTAIAALAIMLHKPTTEVGL